MPLLDSVSSNTDQADLVILSHLETIRDQEQPATASAVASLIGGAPEREIQQRLARLHIFGLVEVIHMANMEYAVTELGAELLRRDLIGWSPSLREEARRQLELRLARDGLWRSRLR